MSLCGCLLPVCGSCAVSTLLVWWPSVLFFFFLFCCISIFFSFPFVWCVYSYVCILSRSLSPRTGRLAFFCHPYLLVGSIPLLVLCLLISVSCPYRRSFAACTTIVFLSFGPLLNAPHCCFPQLRTLVRTLPRLVNLITAILLLPQHPLPDISSVFRSLPLPVCRSTRLLFPALSLLSCCVAD